MLAVSPVVTVIFALIYGAVGALLGALSGWITTVVLKSRVRLTLDGALGAVGFLLGGFVSIVTPWHPNTITYELSGGTTVTSTMNSYQHPERVAIAVAMTLPVLHEVWRRRRQVGE